MLEPPEMFGIVEEGIYRSNALQPANFPFIRQLKLSTCLLLSSELPSRSTLQFFEDARIQLIHLGHSNSSTTTNAAAASAIGGNNLHSSNNALKATNTMPLNWWSTQHVQSTNSWRPISEELVKEGLEIVLNSQKYHPLLIMCTSGVQETGTLVGCLRKLQRWNYTAILGEYRAFAGSKSRYANEQFIELFDLDLVTLPPPEMLMPCFLTFLNE